MSLPEEGGENRVYLTGKVSRKGSLKYTPSGVAVCDFTFAVRQNHFDKASTGYFEVQVLGKSAEDRAADLKIGKKLRLSGSLWARSFKDRQGRLVNETKVLAENIQEAI